MADPAYRHRRAAAAILSQIGHSVDRWISSGKVVEPFDDNLRAVARGLLETEQHTQRATLGKVVMALIADRETTVQRHQWAPVLKRIETEYEAANG